eukprot:TRINITY_DN7119_c0_g1_i3.p2 TRINITY_DN7119_c0_g1~~TRINITY_DN7119_c0_g1_i3.p2  ORF type:complete len:137 (+),score=22.66 TRINITY_DN7119_c0_g1_i3:341-751(+)
MGRLVRSLRSRKRTSQIAQDACAWPFTTSLKEAFSLGMFRTQALRKSGPVGKIGKAMPPPPQPECPSETTCGDIKAAYGTSSCCGTPSALFTMPGNRRLAAATQKDDLLSHISKEMKRAKAENLDAAQALRLRSRA